MTKSSPIEPPPRPSGSLLAGRSTVVTAAAGAGIGFSTARRCIEHGSRVLISDRHEGRLARATDELERLTGHRPLALRCDVTQQPDVDALFAFAQRELGTIDVLVNNAGLG